jgi:hypothetical protein
MWISPEIAAAAIAGHGMRRALWLPGWEHKSVWGWDSGDQSLFAQLYRNGEDDLLPPAGKLWVSPPRYPQTGTTEVLAGWIAAAAGEDKAAVLRAMAESLGDQDGARLRELAAAA